MKDGIEAEEIAVLYGLRPMPVFWQKRFWKNSCRFR